MHFVLPLVLLAACGGPPCDGLFRDRCIDGDIDVPPDPVEQPAPNLFDWSAVCAEDGWHLWALTEGEPTVASLTLTDGLATEDHAMAIEPYTETSSYVDVELVAGTDTAYGCDAYTDLTWRIVVEAANGQDCVVWGAEPALLDEWGWGCQTR